MTLTHRDYFNSIAHNWDTLMKLDTRLPVFMQDFGVTKGDKVLDIGAGTGRLTRYLLSLVGREGQVIAEDIAEEMMHVAHHSIHDPNCYFTCADAHILPFKTESTDKIVCFSVFPHIKQPDYAVREMHRVLKKRGKLLVLHSCCSRKLNQIHAGIGKTVKHDRLPNSLELSDMLTKLGFDCIASKENPELYWVEVIKK